MRYKNSIAVGTRSAIAHARDTSYVRTGSLSLRVVNLRSFWFIVAAFLASAALNDSKWALRSKLPPTMLAMSRGKTGERL